MPEASRGERNSHLKGCEGSQGQAGHGPLSHPNLLSRAFFFLNIELNSLALSKESLHCKSKETGGLGSGGHLGEEKEGGPTPPLLSGCLCTPAGNDWDCSGERGRELVSRILLEQLAHDHHIKMIQAEWYLMIYGIRLPVPEKARY